MFLAPIEMRYRAAMSASNILLRVLLSLILVLNGVWTAKASVQMPMEMAMPSSEQAIGAVDNAAGSHCAGHALAMAASPHDAGHADAPAAIPKPCDPAAPDCCKSSACRCACSQLCASLLPVVTQAPLLAAHDRVVGALAPAYPTPALPHLIRPPIA
jgi:hypothetical protein